MGADRPELQVGEWGADITFRIPPEIWDAVGPNTMRILLDIGPSALVHHAIAAMHYGDASANDLGLPGQFADIWRKIKPLKRAMWEGIESSREQPPEILRDLIGHCLLALRMYEDEEKRASELHDHS